MKLSAETLKTIEEALNHYLNYRSEFGRSTIEQMDLDDKHRVRVYIALKELQELALEYDDLFGLMDLPPNVVA